MTYAAKQWAAALGKATHDVRRKARELNVHRQVGTLLRMFQCYALPAAIYGSQVWGPRHLLADTGQRFNSSVERRRLSFLRCVLGLREGTDRMVVLKEAGQKPLQLYWWRSVLRFYCKIRLPARTGSSPLLSNALLSDRVLHAMGRSDCWTGELIAALRSLGDEGVVFASQVLEGEPIDMSSAMQLVQRVLMMEPWSEGSGRIKRLEYKERCLGAEAEASSSRIPAYVDLDVSKHVVRQVARFRCGSHYLGIETGRWTRPKTPRSDRVCTRCSEQWCVLKGMLGWSGTLGRDGRPVDDEHHALFECEASRGCRVDHWPQGIPPRLACVSGMLQEACESSQVAQFIADCLDRCEPDEHAVEADEGAADAAHPHREP